MNTKGKESKAVLLRVGGVSMGSQIIPNQFLSLKLYLSVSGKVLIQEEELPDGSRRYTLPETEQPPKGKVHRGLDRLMRELGLAPSAYLLRALLFYTGLDATSRWTAYFSADNYRLVNHRKLLPYDYRRGEEEWEPKVVEDPLHAWKLQTAKWVPRNIARSLVDSRQRRVLKLLREGKGQRYLVRFTRQYPNGLTSSFPLQENVGDFFLHAQAMDPLLRKYENCFT